MCVQHLRVISALLHILVEQYQKVSPHEDNNCYLHRCPITDIYTAAHLCKYQLLPVLVFFENNFFENNFLENIFLFLIFFFVIQIFLIKIEKAIFRVKYFYFDNLPWKWANNAFFRLIMMSNTGI